MRLLFGSAEVVSEETFKQTIHVICVPHQSNLYLSVTSEPHSLALLISPIGNVDYQPLLISLSLSDERTSLDNILLANLTCFMFAVALIRLWL